MARRRFQRGARRQLPRGPGVSVTSATEIRNHSSGLRALTIALVLAVVCGGSAFAQGVGKGVRGGVNLTTTETTDDTGGASLDWQPRAVFAGFITWRVASWLQVQPEVIYAMKGAKSEEFGIKIGRASCRERV